ncbi:MAG: ATP-binding cassette domain-containing protein [Desulfobacteraceae bacterium]|nr:MAG: ATP-binding cassette domain-containing protein [Desulfobacteraceae bacterium]
MPVLSVRHLKKYFPVTQGVLLRQKGWVYAVDDVSFDVNQGETLGIVGESGCGKTTLGRCIIGLYTPTHGQVLVHGNDVSSLDRAQKKALSLKIQMIFQDPFESLDSRQTIEQILKEKYVIHKKAGRGIKEEMTGLLGRVGLAEDSFAKFPHEFSGGQRQRIGIARAISLNPDIIVCDEPVSALDVSVQSKILNLLLELQQELGLTYVFISHDLSVVKHISDRIVVMYLGKVVEMGPASEVYGAPRHPYTLALLSAVPIPDPEETRERITLQGEIPSVEHPPAGCRFHTRCRYVQKICKTTEPQLADCGTGTGHVNACHFDGRLREAGGA